MIWCQYSSCVLRLIVIINRNYIESSWNFCSKSVSPTDFVFRLFFLRSNVSKMKVPMLFCSVKRKMFTDFDKIIAEHYWLDLYTLFEHIPKLIEWVQNVETQTASTAWVWCTSDCVIAKTISEFRHQKAAIVISAVVSTVRSRQVIVLCRDAAACTLFIANVTARMHLRMTRSRTSLTERIQQRRST